MSSIVELRVGVDCLGCKKKLRKTLLKLDGVNEVEVDIAMQKATITGYAEEKKILKAIMKIGIRVEPWTMSSYDPQYHDFNHFYDQQMSFMNTSNPSSHRKLNGKIVHEHVYDPVPMVHGNNDAFALLNDDNPKGCSIM